ncbi:MAG: primosomal protein N', partial [Deltaproteobacteria bacterium]|nr:primosomal protein N' [Deltaproteobacteria bacterium]
MYATVALLTPPYASLTYLLPPEFPADFWQPGLRVAVPLGRGERTALRAAVLLRVSPTADIPEGVECKNLAWPLENAPLLSAGLLELAEDLARRQGLHTGHILGHVLPQGLRLARVRLRHIESGQAAAWTLARLREATTQQRQELALALCNGTARMLPPGTDAASEEFCLLRVDPPWPVRPSAKRQIEVLDYLHQHGSVSRRRLVQSLGQAVAPALHTLLEAGHVNLSRESGLDDDVIDATEQSLLPPPPPPFSLNQDQNTALESMLEALH